MTNDILADVRPRSHFLSAPDGLRLHVAEYGSRLSPRLPVVCLAGLSRNGRDFASLAMRLVRENRRVLTLDYRGRGLSDRDRSWRNYDVGIEGDDILAVLGALDVPKAIFVGTSRGGIHMMRMAAVQPTLIAASVLNDIGPIVEPQGLIRIKTRMGALPAPTNWAQAADMLKLTYGQQFPALESRDWDAFARATVRETDETLSWDYDPKLARTLATVSPDMAPMDLWPQFRALARKPVLVLRGSASDILSPATFEAMQAESAGCRGLVVEGQGHAPLLFDSTSQEAIVRFAASIG